MPIWRDYRTSRKICGRKTIRTNPSRTIPSNQRMLRPRRPIMIISSQIRVCPIHNHFTGSACPKCGWSESNPVGVRIDVEKTLVANSATTDTEPENAFDGPEKILHREFQTDMERRGVHCVHCRTDQASTIENGLPDFHCLYTASDGITRACAVEFKRKNGKPSASQIDKIAEMRAKKIPVKICWTLADAIRFTKDSMHIPDEI